MRARQAAAFVGETVGLLLLLLRRLLLLCRPCLISELTGRVARIGPCFEHGEDFRIRCELDIFLSRSRGAAATAVICTSTRAERIGRAPDGLLVASGRSFSQGAGAPT